LKPRKRRPNVTQEFKREVVEAYRNRGTRKVNEIRDRYEVTTSQLHRWLIEFGISANGPRAQLHAKAKPVAAPKKSALPEANGELDRLRRQVEALKQERDVLKKTIMVFARGER
jgi:transposase-like protein